VKKLFIFSAIFICFYYAACTRPSSEVDNLLSSKPQVTVIPFGKTPANDPNFYHRCLATKILPDDKINKIYDYKYIVIGHFPTDRYLLKHKEEKDGVCKSEIKSDDFVVYIVYSNSPIPDPEFL